MGGRLKYIFSQYSSLCSNIGELMEITKGQFVGIINLIKALVERDVPKEELIGYLEQLTQEK